jgi:hypothetical protein
MNDSRELETFISVADSLKIQYIQEGAPDPWASSPFGWIRARPSRQIGKIGEQLVAEWCKAKGLRVTKPGDAQCDLLVNARRVEVKFSTLWQSGKYTFQQFRDQAYEFAILLGLSPDVAHSWIVPKHVLRLHVIGHTPQHAGKKGADTFWLSFPASASPSWLSPFGGALSVASRILLGTFRS